MSDEITGLFQSHGLIACICFFLLGSCVGSFLNVLALRSLKEESIIWPSSYCPKCKHQLSLLDNIPIISYLLLKARCRYCKEPISFQYPLVELATGLTFAAICHFFLVNQIPVANFGGQFPQQPLFAAMKEGHALVQAGAAAGSVPTLDSMPFYKYGLALGAFVFASTLIAVTVTDFREKLIPHEITYPSMLFGITFSALVRNDLLGAMAGIGASYIIFDFLAFYGLKLYMRCRPELFEESQEAHEGEEEIDAELDSYLNLEQKSEAEEPIEVMGGGDAVLSAVMSAYLGWQYLILALIIGFLAGTLMGLALLLVEMKRAGILQECRQKSLFLALISGAVMGGLTVLMLSTVGMETNELIRLFLQSFLLGAGGGAIIGMVLVGTKVSKPFPFGPALALGGFVAMFLIPYCPAITQIGHNGYGWLG